MRRICIDIAERVFGEAARRALEERRSTRDQLSYDVERLYLPDVQVRSVPAAEFAGGDE